LKFKKIKIKNQFMQFALEVVVLECIFINHSQGILEVQAKNANKKALLETNLIKCHEITLSFDP
jgi:hypothetical protein